jgi:rare lipoprotein A (peptidoglycan hydrolase)
LNTGRLIALAACGLALAGAARADEQAAPAPAALNPFQIFAKDVSAARAAGAVKVAAPATVPAAVAPQAEAPAARSPAHAKVLKVSARTPKAEADAEAAPMGETRGITIVPQTTLAPSGNVQLIRASWYGGGERLSAHTANGEVFRPMDLTAAHRTLPFGTMLKVTAPSTGLSTIVRVNDRGPAAYTGYGIDLSRGAATALGIVNKGGQKVTIEVMR